MIDGNETHKALVDAAADDDAADEPAQPSEETPEPAQAKVVIVSEGGKVNIRVGNDTGYGRITSVAPGTTLDYVATAANGWHAVVVNARVGWVSGNFSKVIA